MAAACLCVLCASGLAGSYRPDWLVSDDQAAHLGWWKPLQGGCHLPGEDVFGLVGGTLVFVLSDADHRHHAVSQNSWNDRVDLLVGLPEEAPALGVPDDHVADSEALEHRRAHLSGECALF